MTLMKDYRLFVLSLFILSVASAEEATDKQDDPQDVAIPVTYTFRQMGEALRRIENLLNSSKQCDTEAVIDDSAAGVGGSVYVRWGRTTCPKSSRLLYEGVAGGAYYADKGSGANYVCLPLEPEWANTMDGHQELAASMYGAEYELYYHTKEMFSRANTDGKSLHDHDVPCAVCHAESRSHVMIPAKLTCPGGWKKEYSGYLMSSHRTFARREFVCVDSSPEIDHGGHENKNGALFYFTEAYCGSLPCPPYREGHELTCVVCTK